MFNKSLDQNKMLEKITNLSAGAIEFSKDVAKTIWNNKGKCSLIGLKLFELGAYAQPLEFRDLSKQISNNPTAQYIIGNYIIPVPHTGKACTKEKIKLNKEQIKQLKDKRIVRYFRKTQKEKPTKQMISNLHSALNGSFFHYDGSDLVQRYDEYVFEEKQSDLYCFIWASLQNEFKVDMWTPINLNSCSKAIQLIETIYDKNEDGILTEEEIEQGNIDYESFELKYIKFTYPSSEKIRYCSPIVTDIETFKKEFEEYKNSK